MKLPISFDEVSYFKNEYRGDLIVTRGVLYYFPHTRVAYSRFADELGGRGKSELIGAVGQFIPLLGLVPWIRTAADRSLKFGKLIQRNLAPSTNRPRIRNQGLWLDADDSVALQNRLDRYIEKVKSSALNFDGDAVPKPMRFASSEVENLRLGVKFCFDARYDTHDFRVSPFRRGLLQTALREAGFLG